ncbi:SEC59/DGK1/VTE5 family protein [Bacteriovorax sp. PP10]|uniref:SEC59/DGK1/VTE5 family protein n=1 Tax=Bacteriovorax antarcticus TaxID=3088717 RepID=A0ABU5VVB5_9BACT|nr:SEC59/DGK1/VTE5 family protein [Bacteriovorax sp. PP10]MEA9356877.1 SEC59/DGK1/VTE5 family protein [Bacteriovorax sp. PP10]
MGQAFMSQFRISSPLRMRSDLHLTRKVWHISTGLIGLVVYKKSGFTPEFTATALLTLAIAAFLFELLRLKNEKVNQLAMVLMKPVMRESERNSVSGLPFYALGVSLALFFFPERIAILAILFLIFADPIASFIGILYGRDKILPNKSLQGTIAAFSVCYIATLVYGMIYVGPSMNLLLFAVAAGIIGCVSEMCSQFVDDNLCIPVVSGLGLFLVNFIFQIF